MSLSAGTRLGDYEILSEIGSGGMGVVYRARDRKLGRDVALKVLPEAFARDRQRRARFEREARLLASLNHPNVATLHGFEQSGELHFLVMEMVEGETLADTKARDRFSMGQVLDIFKQIAEALEAAHQKGIVHRDLKPANIKITPEGRVKILDFGLAKAVPEALAATSVSPESPTLSRGTEAGVVLGTAAYMSPEQSKGQSVDERTDVWAFGCVFYEVLTGRPAFGAETFSETVANILGREPEWRLLPGNMPAHISDLLRLCLQKDPERRLQDIAMARRALEKEPAVPRWVGRSVRVAVVAFLILTGIYAVWHSYLSRKPAVSSRTMIVVLPFENLGPSEHEYFASGIADEITSRLATVHDVGVISRKSAVHYARTDQPLKEIGEELGVDYVLEGTVRWESVKEDLDRVRVTPQLIRVVDDTQMWSETYDREISEIFDVQSEIADHVTRELGITLLAPERHSIESRPTENLDAYQAYLRGRYYFSQPEFWGENLSRALAGFQKSVELDPQFAVAYAELSKALSAYVHLGIDVSEERRAEAKRAADRALELAPESPHAHHALGVYYYWAERDYDRALEELAVAERAMPNNAEVVEVIAAVQQRRGRGQDALASYQKAVEMNPRDARLSAELGVTYAVLRRYREAVARLDDSIALAPNQSLAYSLKTMTYWAWKATTKESRAALEACPEADVLTPWLWFWQEIYEGNARAALQRLSSLPDERIYFVELEAPKSLLSGYAHALLNEPELSRRDYDAARRVLENEVRQRPEDAPFRSALGLAYAGLGRKEDAIREGERAVELYPVSKDAFWGPSHVEYLAWIYTMVGEEDAALDQIEYLLSIPCMVSVPLLRLDPRWAPLRDHPRFPKPTR